MYKYNNCYNCTFGCLHISGNGCGHTVMATESGTLASQNYPWTYPVDSWCKWRLRVPKGRTLHLLFGDFDVERSPGCRNGSLTITPNNGAPSLGKTLQCTQGRRPGWLCACLYFYKGFTVHAIDKLFYSDILNSHSSSDRLN